MCRAKFCVGNLHFLKEFLFNFSFLPQFSGLVFAGNNFHINAFSIIFFSFFPKLYPFSNFCPIMYISRRAKVIGKSVIKFTNQKRIHIHMYYVETKRQI